MAEISLDGKVALITGAGRGMGRELAVAFARAGAAGVTVTAAAAVDETRAEIETELAETVALIEAAGGKGRAIHADILSRADCEAAVGETVSTFGALHILCNHAGKSQRYHGPRDIPFWETEPDGYQLVMTTNTIGAYLMSRAAVPHLLKNGWGRIINTSKGLDSMHEAFAGAYGPSKAALEAESLSWAEELAGSGVTVNCMEPGGPVPTKFGRGKVAGSSGLAVDVMVPCALWLASDESDGISGCRFDAKNWNPDLPAREAGLACRDVPLFPKPTSRKGSKLDLAWEVPGQK
jgi:NAD(P)-dependent dehydrogenase (short-subunit alcohol dehydrogenase family)